MVMYEYTYNLKNKYIILNIRRVCSKVTCSGKVTTNFNELVSYNSYNSC